MKIMIIRHFNETEKLKLFRLMEEFPLLEGEFDLLADYYNDSSLKAIVKEYREIKELKLKRLKEETI